MKTDALGNVLGLPFTPEQLEAITAPPEPAVIVAGAGSGKTTVMAARVVWLVASGAVRPDQVLGLTFTNKAAGELGHRLRVALAKLDRWGSRNGPGSRSASDGEERAGEPTVLTYHAYAARLLGEHGLRIGVEPEARLLADPTRYQLAARVIRGAPGPFTAVTGRVADVVGDLVALDAELSEHLVAPDELRAYDQALRQEIAAVPEPATDLQRVVAAIDKRAELASLIDAYRRQKRQRSVVDFADQMAFAATLAERRPEVGRAERDRYRVVLLDEYQDTSVAQRRLLAGLFGGGYPVTAVGDPCQAIYGWRGASVANLQDFPRHFPRGDGTPARRYELTENRRSGERILAAANELSVPLRRSYHAIPPLRPGPDGAARGGWIRCALHETYSEEVEWVGDQVAGAIAEGVPPAEIAILVRVTSDFAPIHSALTSRNIPVEVVGLGGLLSLPEVADVVAVLRVLDDPTSNAALVRLLAGPRWRIGPRDLAMLGRRAAQLVTVPAAFAEGTHPSVSAAPAESSAGAADAVLEEAVGGIDPAEVVSLADALTSPGHLSYSAEASDRFAALAKEIRVLRRHLGEPLLDLLHQVVSMIGLDVELGASPQSRAARRRESLAAFFDVAAQFRDLEDDTSLAAFLAYLDAADEHDRGLDSAAPTGAESVKLLTVHKAKGLEWDVVLLPDLTATVFPSGRGRTRWTRSGKVLPYPLRGDAGSVPEVADWTRAGLAAFDQACKDVDELEERRLGYVAVTRPRRLLIASSHWWGMSQKKRRGPSPYLNLLIAQCRSGAGEVARWVDEPDEELENPYLNATAEAAWPVALEPGALQLRRAAADLVRSLAAKGRSAGVDGGGDARDVRPGVYEQLALLELPSSASPDPDSLTPAEAAQVAGWDRDVALLLGEARRLRKRNREVEMPTTLSASQLMRVADDPDGFARELARPMPRKPDPAARRGTRFHAWVESRFGQQPLLDEDELPGAADAEIADEADLTALRRSFEHTDYAERVPHAVEAPFQLLLAGHVVRGRIDAVYETDDGGFEVIDWKTGREQSADPLQLAIYRLAWAEMHGLPVDRVHAAFAYIRSGETVRHDDLPGREELEAIISVGATESAG